MRETFESVHSWIARKPTESNLPSSFPFASLTPVKPRGSPSKPQTWSWSLLPGLLQQDRPAVPEEDGGLRKERLIGYTFQSNEEP